MNSTWSEATSGQPVPQCTMAIPCTGMSKSPQELTGGPTAPLTLLSAWFRPHYWMPGRDTIPLPWQTHFDLKEILSLPEAVATDSEVVFGAPVRPGDRIRCTETLRSLSEVKTTKLGMGRFWVIDAVCRNQHDVWVGTETMTGFGYRSYRTA